MLKNLSPHHFASCNFLFDFATIYFSFLSLYLYRYPLYLRRLLGPHGDAFTFEEVFGQRYWYTNSSTNTSGSGGGGGGGGGGSASVLPAAALLAERNNNALIAKVNIKFKCNLLWKHFTGRIPLENISFSRMHITYLTISDYMHLPVNPGPEAPPGPCYWRYTGGTASSLL